MLGLQLGFFCLSAASFTLVTKKYTAWIEITAQVRRKRSHDSGFVTRTSQRLTYRMCCSAMFAAADAMCPLQQPISPIKKLTATEKRTWKERNSSALQTFLDCGKGRSFCGSLVVFSSQENYACELYMLRRDAFRGRRINLYCTGCRRPGYHSGRHEAAKPPNK